MPGMTILLQVLYSQPLNKPLEHHRTVICSAWEVVARRGLLLYSDLAMYPPVQYLVTCVACLALGTSAAGLGARSARRSLLSTLLTTRAVTSGGGHPDARLPRRRARLRARWASAMQPHAEDLVASKGWQTNLDTGPKSRGSVQSFDFLDEEHSRDATWFHVPGATRQNSAKEERSKSHKQEEPAQLSREEKMDNTAPRPEKMKSPFGAGQDAQDTGQEAKPLMESKGSKDMHKHPLRLAKHFMSQSAYSKGATTKQSNAGELKLSGSKKEGLKSSSSKQAKSDEKGTSGSMTGRSNASKTERLKAEHRHAHTEQWDHFPGAQQISSAQSLEDAERRVHRQRKQNNKGSVKDYVKLGQLFAQGVRDKMKGSRR